MAFKKVNSDWGSCPDVNRSYFIMDTVDDVPSLPACCTGSIAVAAEGGKVYMVNASGKWVESGTASYNLAEGVSF